MTREAPLLGLALEAIPSIDEQADYSEAPDRRLTLDLDEATVITSRVVGSPGGPDALHKVVLDIDLPAKLIPSTTEGHFHLYIDKALPWPDYVALLEALQAAGLIEPGYVSASIARGHTAARLPWVKKKPASAPAPSASF